MISVFQKDEHPILYDEVKAIIIGESTEYKNASLDFTNLDVKWYIYTLDYFGPLQQSECDDEGEIVVSTQLVLPSVHLINLWENLYYDSDIKQNVWSQLN